MTEEALNSIFAIAVLLMSGANIALVFYLYLTREKTMQVDKIKRRTINWVLHKAREPISANEIYETWFNPAGETKKEDVITGGWIPERPSLSELQEIISELAKDFRIHKVDNKIQSFGGY